MNWFELLKTKVDALGRRKVEADTGMSKTTLSQVLNNKYNGNMNNIQSQVLAAYTAVSVDCPVLGDIPVKRCNKERIKPCIGSNPIRVKLFRACKSCRHNQHGAD